MEFLVGADEETWSTLHDDFNYKLHHAYHPDNRLMMPFKPGVRADGTIIDAVGPPSQHPGFVDERGKLLDLIFSQTKK